MRRLSAVACDAAWHGDPRAVLRTVRPRQDADGSCIREARSILIVSMTSIGTLLRDLIRRPKRDLRAELSPYRGAIPAQRRSQEIARETQRTW